MDVLLENDIYLDALGEWLRLHGISVPYTANNKGMRQIIRNGEVQNEEIHARVVFTQPVDGAVVDVLKKRVSTSVYPNTPTQGNVIVEFVVPGAVGDVTLRVYDNDNNLVGEYVDTLDNQGVAGVTLQVDVPETYYVVIWRADIPPVFARVTGG